MSKSAEYRQHAQECRRLAGTMGAHEHREQLLEMAATWERMADERERSAHLEEDRSFQPRALRLQGHG